MGIWAVPGLRLLQTCCEALCEILGGRMFSFFLYTFLGPTFLGCTGSTSLTLQETAPLFSKMVEPIYICIDIAPHTYEDLILPKFVSTFL